MHALSLFSVEPVRSWNEKNAFVNSGQMMENYFAVTTNIWKRILLLLGIVVESEREFLVQ